MLLLARIVHWLHVALIAAMLASPALVAMRLIPWWLVVIAGVFILAINVTWRRGRLSWGSCPLTRLEYALLDRATGRRHTRRSLMGRILRIRDERTVSRIMAVALVAVTLLGYLLRGV